MSYTVEGGYTGDWIGMTGDSPAGIPDVTRVTNPRQPDTNNYLANNYFKMEFTRLPTVTYFCQRVNLPSLSFTPVEKANPTGIIEKWMGGRYLFEDLTVSFQVDESMKNWLEVYNWMGSISPSWDHGSLISGQYNQDFFSNATLNITNSAYKPKLKVMFHDLFPTSISGIDFDSTSTENEPVIATATFAYTYYTVEEYTTSA